MKNLMIVMMTLVMTLPGLAQKKTFYINSSLKNCTGVAPMECMQYREKPDEPWKLMYQPIEGFNYEAGFLYALRVKLMKVSNPPADGSSIRYKLVKIISKTKDNAMQNTQLPAPNGKYLLTSLMINGKLTDVSAKAYEVALNKENSQLQTKLCNNIAGGYTIDGTAIKFGPMRSTRMMCEDMATETAFTAALETIDNFSYDRAKLHLKKGEVIVMTLTMPVR